MTRSRDKAERGPEWSLLIHVYLGQNRHDNTIEVSVDGRRLGKVPVAGDGSEDQRPALEGLPPKRKVELGPKQDGEVLAGLLFSALRPWVELVAPIEHRTSWELDDEAGS